jgi:hypothetical protein
MRSAPLSSLSSGPHGAGWPATFRSRWRRREASLRSRGKELAKAAELDPERLCIGALAELGEEAMSLGRARDRGRTIANPNVRALPLGSQRNRIRHKVVAPFAGHEPR